MQALIRFFLELAMLRRGPQDVPASSALLTVAGLVNVFAGTANGAELFGGLRASLGANLLDLALTLLLLFALLQITRHLPRWQQTATAFLGLGALAGGIMLVVRSLAVPLGMVGLAVFVELVVAAWLHVALGNVLRHAMGVPLLAGVIIVLSYTILAFNLIARVFPPVNLT